MADTAKRKTTTRAKPPAEDAGVEAALGEGGVAVADDPALEALAEIRHKRGCPSKDAGLDGPRIEVIRHRVSSKGLDEDRGGDNDGDESVIVRCVDCGNQFPE